MSYNTYIGQGRPVISFPGFGVDSNNPQTSGKLDGSLCKKRWVCTSDSHHFPKKSWMYRVPLIISWITIALFTYETSEVGRCSNAASITCFFECVLNALQILTYFSRYHKDSRILKAWVSSAFLNDVGLMFCMFAFMYQNVKDHIEGEVNTKISIHPSLTSHPLRLTPRILGHGH